MIKKKTQARIFGWLGILALAGDCHLLQAQAIRVEDCVAAVVDTQIITLVDVKIAERFGLYCEEIKDKALPAVLESLVKQKIMINFAPHPAPVSAEEIDIAMKKLEVDLGSEAFRKGLAEFGFEENDLKPYIEEMLLCRKILYGRFNDRIRITLQEIEDYYRAVYVPAQKEAGGEPLPMVQILDRLEASIQAQKREEQSAAWIESLKAKAYVRLHKDCLK